METAVQATGQPKVLRRTDYQPPEWTIPEVKLTFHIIDETRVEVHATLQVERNGDYALLPVLALNCHSSIDVQSVQLDGILIPSSAFERGADTLTLHPSKPFFRLDIAHTLRPKKNESGDGFYCTGSGMVTQCEAHGFQKIIPFIDRPDNLGIYTTTILANKEKHPVILSNGNECARRDLPDGRHTVTFKDPFRKPSYLYALVAGDFDVLEDRYTTKSGREVKISIYTEKEQLHKCRYAMESLKAAMKWDEERWRLECDLDEYKIVAVHDFNMGAMENKGLNVFHTSLTYADPATSTDTNFENVEGVIGHEYFHNYRGNRVTCRDWFQLTLKEGLTVFTDQEFSADMNSRVLQRIDDVRMLRSRQFGEDAGPNAHPIRPDEVKKIDNFYSATVYEKGAEVIRMIHTMIGEEKFRQGLTLYLTRHDGQAVTCDDFLQAMQEVSGLNLNQFKETWYAQKGTPTCRVQQHYDVDARTLTLTIEQILPHAGDRPYHFPFAMGLLGADGRELVNDILHVRERRQSFIFSDIPSLPVVSPLRNFSAPMKLDFDQSKEDLRFLMMHDGDGFNRYEAVQRIAKQELHELIMLHQRGEGFNARASVVDAFGSVVAYANEEPAIAARMLQLPSLDELVQDMEVYDIDAAYEAREFFIKEIAYAYEQQLLYLYYQYHHTGEYKKDAASIAARSIKNRCLGYLMTLDGKYADTALRQFGEANNMTDEYGALILLCDETADIRDGAVGAFYSRWRGDALTFNKWVTAQAFSEHHQQLLPRLEEIEKLPEFNAKTPNCCYALYGTLAANLIEFHKKNGEGYRFIADRIIAIDAYNPQVAARFAREFDDFSKLDGSRHVLMRHELERIRDHAASANVQEVIGKILEL